MCLAIPMKITRIEAGGRGVCESAGARVNVDLSLLDQPRVGEYVIVHTGFAIERLDREEARAQLALFEEIAGLMEKDEPARPA
jgi:hydrogenase expression/formation protein HypC